MILMHNCVAIDGHSADGEWKNWNLSVLSVLLTKNNQNPDEISQRIAYHEKNETTKYIRKIRTQISKKNKKTNNLHYLRKNEYVNWDQDKDLWDDPSITITQKGFYTVLANQELLNRNIQEFDIDKKFNNNKPISKDKCSVYY